MAFGRDVDADRSGVGVGRLGLKVRPRAAKSRGPGGPRAARCPRRSRRFAARITAVGARPSKPRDGQNMGTSPPAGEGPIPPKAATYENVEADRPSGGQWAVAVALTPSSVETVSWGQYVPSADALKFGAKVVAPKDWVDRGAAGGCLLHLVCDRGLDVAVAHALATIRQGNPPVRGRAARGAAGAVNPRIVARKKEDDRRHRTRGRLPHRRPPRYGVEVRRIAGNDRAGGPWL